MDGGREIDERTRACHARLTATTAQERRQKPSLQVLPACLINHFTGYLCRRAAKMVHLSKPGHDTGHFNTSEVRVKVNNQSSKATSRIIALPRGHYKGPPNLAAGFSCLDVSSEAPIRANLLADQITKDDFRISIETWGDSVLYEGGATGSSIRLMPRMPSSANTTPMKATMTLKPMGMAKCESQALASRANRCLKLVKRTRDRFSSLTLSRSRLR